MVLVGDRGLADLNKHVHQGSLNEGLHLRALVARVLTAQIFAHKHDVQHFSVDDYMIGRVYTTRHPDMFGTGIYSSLAVGSTHQ